MASDIKRLYDYTRTLYAARKSFRKQQAVNAGRKVCFWNWWEDEAYDELWLNQFVRNTGLLDKATKPIHFCSLFGKREVLQYVDGPKVFVTGENVHLPYHYTYADGLLREEKCALSLGFDAFDDDRYLRFPLWMMSVFEPTTDEKQIKERCEQLRYPEIGDRKKFAALVARYDWSGTRSQIYEAIKHVAPIGCPSAVLHNDEELLTKYNDDKLEYLKQFAFNICPENSNAYGYVTEKVFQAIAAGCIPIYWGSYNMPEIGILNQDAIIRWNMNGDNTENVKLIEDLWAHPKRLEEFLSQPRLLPEADDKLVLLFNELRTRLERIV